MRRLAALATALLVVGAAALARAQDDQRPANALLTNPLATAKAEDWSVYSVSIRVFDAQGTKKGEQTIVLRDRVEEVSDDTVKLGTQFLLKKDDLFSDAFRSFSRRASLELRELFAFTGGDRLSGYPKGEAKLTHFETADAKRTVDGKEFAGTLVTFAVEQAKPEMKTEAKLWLSPAVKAKGIVALESRTRSAEPDPRNGCVRREVDWTLVATGHGDATEWGKVPADLAAVDVRDRREERK